jgi:hypothetical protein
MATAAPVDIAVNPSDTSQRYILWSNGPITAVNAPPITSGPDWISRAAGPPGVAIHITNWSTGAGWVLDYRGFFTALNGATHPNVSSDAKMSGITVTANPLARQYVDFEWDPTNPTQGYVLDGWGKIWPFGGASAPPRTGTRWGTQIARKLRMRFTPSKLAMTLDKYGRIYGDWSATVGSVASTLKVPTKTDFARDFVVMDWTTGSGYILTADSAMHVFGTRTRPFGWTPKPGGDVARTLAVLSASNPESFNIVWANGQSFDFVSSTPPSVTAGGTDPVSPAATETTTTRPDLRWDYNDPQSDEQKEAEALVFTSAFAAGHDMTDPLVWLSSALVALETTDRTARGFTNPVDLPNGSYVLYVHAKDTADQWSAWSSYSWTQNVAAPPTPTGFTATANQTPATVSLSVTTTTGTADTVKFEWTTDAWATVNLVRGAEAVPRTGTTTATDYDAPIGVTRTYRARTYSTNPRVLSAASNTAAATITQVPYHWLTSVDDPTLGGKVQVTNLIEWKRPINNTVLYALGAKFPTVLEDGSGPKARLGDLNLVALDAASWSVLDKLLTVGGVLVHRDPLGNVVYFKPAGDWTQARMAPMESSYSSSFPLVEVAPPVLAV